MTSTGAWLELQGVQLRIGPFWLAQDLTTSLAPGRMHAIIGPNGTGKTSLLRALFGDMRLSGGRIAFDGVTLSLLGLPSWRKRLSYMPQDTTIAAALSVMEVVILGRLDQLRMHTDDETIALAETMLRDVGLLHLADRDITTLSGGQRQLVLFAQALMRMPRIMLLDEPVSALDLHHQRVLLDTLHRNTRQHDWITVMVLHDLNLAAQYADNLLVMGQGRLQCSGPPAEVLQPDLLQRVYGVPVEVMRDSLGSPVVQPRRTMPAPAATP